MRDDKKLTLIGMMSGLGGVVLVSAFILVRDANQGPLNRGIGPLIVEYFVLVFTLPALIFGGGVGYILGTLRHRRKQREAMLRRLDEADE